MISGVGVLRIGILFQHPQQRDETNPMNKDEMVKLGIALGACYAVWKYAGSATAKAAAIAVGAVIVAKRLPYVSDVL